MKVSKKNFLKKILIERISNISATRNQKDSKYPLTISMSVVPTTRYAFETGHPNFDENYDNFIKSNFSKIERHLVVQGDYAQTGNNNIKTLRIKIQKQEWPDEWVFPETELERRLFLQQFRLINLDILKSYDEGGEEYEKLFPPDVQNIKVEFEQNEASPKKEETPKNDSKEEKTETDSNPAEKNEISVIIDSMELIDYLIQEARDASEIEIAKELFEIYKTLAMEAIKLKQEE